MESITREDALKILEGEGIGCKGRGEKVLRHLIKVNQIAVYIARKLISKGENIDLNLVDLASLLHDVGKKAQDETGIGHAITGEEILNKMGLTEIAKITRKHSINSVLEENLKPKTWEEKLVYYADKRVNVDKIVSLDERMVSLKIRHPKIIPFLPKIVPEVKKIEQEIKEVIGEDYKLDEINK